jgi:hypothetical protein
MKHIHTHLQLASHSFKELRLCRLQEDLSNAHNTMVAGREIMANTALNGILEKYANVIRTDRRFESIAKPQDRSYFFALAINDVLPKDAANGRPKYSEKKKDEMRPFQPLVFNKYKDLNDDQLEQKLKTENTKLYNALYGGPLSVAIAYRNAADMAEQNYRTTGQLPDDDLAVSLVQMPTNLRADMEAAFRNRPSTYSSTTVARFYLEEMNNAQNRFWVRGEIQDDDLKYLTTQVERYQAARDTLNSMLDKAGMRIPGVDSGKTFIRGNNLTRDEYLGLLRLVWNGDEVAVQKAIDEKLVGARKILEQNKEENKRTLMVYTDISFERVGPSETLQRYGIDVGPVVIRDYLRQRYQGSKQPGGVQPGLPGGAAAMNPGESAGSWKLMPDGPKKALRFLNNRLAGGKEGDDMTNHPNAKFLNALRWYTENDWKEPVTDADKLAAGNMSGADVQSILGLVVEELVESEKQQDLTSNNLEDLRTRVDYVKGIENEVPKLWEYMKDFREHPVGSAILWVGAIMAVRGAWKFMTADRSAFSKIFWGGLAGAIGYGLYKKNQTGEAWWDGAFKSAKEIITKEKALPPDKRILPNYWADRLDKQRILMSPAGSPSTAPELTPKKTAECFALLSEQPADKVIKWYSEMNALSPQDRVRRGIQMPFNISGYRHLFGEMPQKEIGNMFYMTLHRFFEDRGRVAKRELPPEMRDGIIKDGLDDAGAGLAYIEERYVKRQYFALIGLSILRKIDVTFNKEKTVALLSSWSPDDPVLKKIKAENPDLYAVLDSLRSIVWSESKEQASAQWEMHYIFQFEANTEELRRSGGIAQAGLLERIQSGVGEIIKVGDKFFRRTFFNSQWWLEEVLDPLNQSLQPVRDGIKYAWNATKGAYEATVNGVIKYIYGPPPPGGAPPPPGGPPPPPAIPPPGGAPPAAPSVPAPAPSTPPPPAIPPPGGAPPAAPSVPAPTAPAAPPPPTVPSPAGSPPSPAVPPPGALL